jgi:hypothetical protein
VQDEREENNQIGGVGYGNDHWWFDGHREPRGRGCRSETRPRGLPRRISGIWPGVSRSRLPTRLALRRVVSTVSTLLVRTAIPAVPSTLPVPLSVPLCLPQRRFPECPGILRGSTTSPSPWVGRCLGTRNGDVTVYWVSASGSVASPYLSLGPLAVPNSTHAFLGMGQTRRRSSRADGAGLTRDTLKTIRSKRCHL